jgi:hypothetical protein
MSEEKPACGLCGEPMPEGEEVFKFHGYSGPCPKPPLPKPTGHHIDAQGRFQSDKYPDLPPDKIVLSFNDPEAREALLVLAQSYSGKDPELTADIRKRLETPPRR